MGLLSAGTPMSWEEARGHADHVRHSGIEQFIHIFRHYEGVRDAPFLWGDEVEFLVAEVDAANRHAALALRSPAILSALKVEQDAGGDAGDSHGAVYHPEYANWMIEATPRTPFGKAGGDIAKVERNMWRRRQAIRRHLRANEELFSIPVFPRLGALGFAAGGELPNPDGEVSQSVYVPDAAIQPHPRFSTLTANIRKRRGEKVMISVPIFKDAETAATLERQAAGILAADPEHGPNIVQRLGDNIYMDAMAFGMGAGCLQVTMQAPDVHAARTLYDQLAVLAPVMLALTAASPIWKGMLADTDVRWNVISASVDDRSAVERGVQNGQGPAQPPADTGSSQRIYKSRYSSIDCFIGQSAQHREALNDVPVAVNAEAQRQLAAAGIDSSLARHVAHLFVRDPLVLYHERLCQDNSADNDHFENLQSTNWNTVRFKPPPSAANNALDIKWRVEFRPMEVGLTDFENAAFAAFTVLISRAILEHNLDLYMPISKIDANMDVAHARDAVSNKVFFFRHSHVPASKPSLSPVGVCAVCAGRCPEEGLAQLTIDEIMNGSCCKGVVGLLDRARAVLDADGCAGNHRLQLESYLHFIGLRASGKLMTTAAWLRHLVLSHPDYCYDSVVSEAITADVLMRCRDVAEGHCFPRELLPDLTSAAAYHSALAAGNVDGTRGGRNRPDCQTCSVHAVPGGHAADAAFISCVPPAPTCIGAVC